MHTQEIVSFVQNILSKIIDSNVEYFREAESFKVRPGYGYDKFYLDWVDGSYDMSLQGLIHYILLEEGIYKKILTPKQYKDMEEVVKECPECLYSPSEEEDDNYYELQYDTLDVIYADSIMFVGSRLMDLGFDVKETFSGYLD